MNEPIEREGLLFPEDELTIIMVFCRKVDWYGNMPLVTWLGGGGDSLSMPSLTNMKMGAFISWT